MAGIYVPVASGTVTQANMKISAVAGTAFIDFSAVDALTLKLGHLLKVRDSSKRLIQGFIKAAGTSETLDATNLITEWTNVNYDVFTSVASPDIVSAIYSTSGTQTATTNSMVTAVGKLYKLVATWTNVAGQAPTLTGTNGFVTATLSAGANNIYFVATGTSIVITSTNTAAASWGCTFVLKQVTAPAATGVTISSTKGGSTMNFAQKDASFNYNDSSGYTYEIYKVLDAPVVASDTITAGNALMDTTTANAFAAPVGVDLSAYQDGRHILALYNTSGGYAAIGHISATPPGGLTKGAAKNVVGITKANPGVMTLTAGHGYTDNMLVYLSGLTEMTELNTKYKTLTGSSGDTFTVGDTSAFGAAETTGGSCIERVTDCATTGALLLSTKGGSRGYLYKHASFDPNAAMTYKVLYTGDGFGYDFDADTILQIVRIKADGGTIVDPYWADSVIKTMKAQGIYTSAEFIGDANMAYKNAGAGAVSSLYDWSGNNNDATQATGANQPIWTAAQQNGKAGFVFNGTSHFLNGGAGAQFTNVLSIIEVSKCTNTAGNYSMLMRVKSDGSTDEFIFQLNYADTSPWVSFRNKPWYAAVNASIFNYHLAVATGQYDTAAFTLFINGSNISLSTAGSTGGAGNANVYGVDSSEAAGFTKGPVSLLGTFNVLLSTAQRQALESLINAYYAIY